MSSHRSGAVLWQGLALILLLSLTNGQVTETIKRSDIYEEPGNEDAVPRKSKFWNESDKDWQGSVGKVH